VASVRVDPLDVRKGDRASLDSAVHVPEAVGLRGDVAGGWCVSRVPASPNDARRSFSGQEVWGEKSGRGGGQGAGASKRPTTFVWRGKGSAAVGVW